MSVTETITANEFRTQLSEGSYRAVTQAVVYLSYGKGDGRRDLEFVVYQPGEEFAVPLTTPGHWYGLDPLPGKDLDPFSTSPAVVEMIAEFVAPE